MSIEEGRNSVFVDGHNEEDQISLNFENDMLMSLAGTQSNDILLSTFMYTDKKYYEQLQKALEDNIISLTYQDVILLKSAKEHYCIKAFRVHFGKLNTPFSSNDFSSQVQQGRNKSNSCITEYSCSYNTSIRNLIFLLRGAPYKKRNIIISELTSNLGLICCEPNGHVHLFAYNATRLSDFSGISYYIQEADINALMENN